MPIPSNNNFQVASDGSISFTPNLVGDSYFALKIEEYNNSTLVGSIVIDGICVSTPSCQLENSFAFSNWLGSSSNTIITNIVEDDFCSEFTIAPNNGNSISNIEILQGNYTTASNINYNPDGSASVTICVNFPLIDYCNDAMIEDINIRVTGENIGNCLAQIAGEGTEVHNYQVILAPSHFCVDELYFTNRNSISGIPMPIYAEAKQTIWVGDNMPSQYFPNTISPDFVEINNPTILKAGNAINLPSCIGGGTGCITFDANNGSVDLIITPINCSIDCPYPPLTISCDKVFDCDNEKIVANVSGGSPPYLFYWDINGQNFITSENELNVHDIISNITGEINYSCHAVDISTQEIDCFGQLLGTKRFYEDIRSNTTFYNFPTDNNGNTTTVNSPAGYYYNASIFVTPNQASSIYDGINFYPTSINTNYENPPYYGATEMEFIIFNSFGGEILHQNESIISGNDWSIDNFAIYWNGFMNNNTSSPCSYSGGGDHSIFNYRLIAKNCYSKNINSFDTNSNPQPTDAHIENASIIVDDCYTGNNDVIPAGFITNNSPSLGQRNTPYSSTELGLHQTITSLNKTFTCSPNPTYNYFNIFGEYQMIDELIIIDSNGKIIFSKKRIVQDTQINIDSLQNGVYQIIFTDETGVKQRLKLIKI